MNFQITGRRVEVTDAIRNYLGGKLQSIMDNNPHIENVHAIIDIERHNHIVKIIVQAKRHLRFEVQSKTDDMYKSIDKTLDKLDARLKRARKKIKAHTLPRKRVKLSDFERAIEDNKEQT